MTVAATNAYSGPYVGNGSTTSFPFTFKAMAAGEVGAVVDGVEISSSLFEVAVASQGGTLTFNGAPISGAEIYIVSRPDFSQDISFTNAGAFLPEAHDEALDRAAVRDISLRADVDRALKVPIGAVAPDYDDFATAFQGDPGGNIESVALFTTLALGLTDIPAGTNRVRSSGHTEDGWGDANYAHNILAFPVQDAAYVAANPTSSFLALDGRAFVLAEVTRTPAMFGCIGFKRGLDTDLTCNDDGPALQKFFDYSMKEENRHLAFDLSGREWMTGQELFATYPVVVEGSLERHVLRRFINGRIRCLPLSRQAGGVPMDYILTIGGHHQFWGGLLSLSGFDENGSCPAWASMRAKNGIRLFFATQTLFGKVVIEGVKRDGVYYDPYFELDGGGDTIPFTFRDGEPNEVTYSYSNNIGVRFDHLFVRTYGMGSMAAGKISKSWTLKVHGGMPVGGPFDPDHAAYVSSNNPLQRTKLTFDTTEDFRQNDYGKVRLELFPATYGTIAADAVAGTLTWSAGDPVSANLVVGDVIIPQSGINEGKRLEIISFTGTSNRVITVSSSIQTEELAKVLETEAATAVTGLFTRWAPYLVTDILSATEVLVWPWMEDRVGATGKWNFCGGFAANVTGSNTTTVSFANLTGLNGAGTLNSQSLYGPLVGSMRAEAVEFGVVQGLTYSSSNLAVVVEYAHCELCEWHILQTTAGNNVEGFAKGGSNLFKSRILAMNNKTAAGNTVMPFRTLNNFTIIIRGEVLTSRMERPFSGVDTATFTLSNIDRQCYAVRPQNGPITCNLAFNFETARLAGRHNYAAVFWVGPTGAAPTGDMTFGLSADLTLRGWAILGANPVSAPAKPCEIRATYYEVTKKVILTRFDSA